MGSSEAARTLCLVCKDGLQDPQATEGTVYAKTEILPLAPVPRPLQETVFNHQLFQRWFLCAVGVCAMKIYTVDWK